MSTTRRGRGDITSLWLRQTLSQNDCIINTPSNGLEFAGLHVWSQHLLNPNGCGDQDIGLNTCLNSLVELCRKLFEFRQGNIVGRWNRRFGVDSFFGVTLPRVYISILNTSQAVENARETQLG